MDKDKANHINAWLSMKYGCNYDGQPKYRLILGSEHFEYRRGLFYEHHDLVGDCIVEGTKLVPKYNYINDNVWVLEKLKPYNPEQYPELVNMKKLHYDVLFIFHNTKTWEAVEPLEADIDMFVYFDLNKTLKGHKPTEAEMARDHLAQREANRKVIREKIEGEIGGLDSHEIPHALVHGSAIVVPGGADEKGKDSPQQ